MTMKAVMNVQLMGIMFLPVVIIVIPVFALTKSRLLHAGLTLVTFLRHIWEKAAAMF